MIRICLSLGGVSINCLVDKGSRFDCLTKVNAENFVKQANSICDKLSINLTRHKIIMSDMIEI